MRPNTYLTIEIYGLLIGLLGAQVIGVAMLFIPSLSSGSNRLFYSGQPGAVVMSLLILFGIIGSVFFVINLLQKLSMQWHYRLTGFAVFYLALGIIFVLAS